jgi:hypothetical protein
MIVDLNRDSIWPSFEEAGKEGPPCSLMAAYIGFNENGSIGLSWFQEYFEIARCDHTYMGSASNRDAGRMRERELFNHRKTSKPNLVDPEIELPQAGLPNRPEIPSVEAWFVPDCEATSIPQQ